MAFRSLPDHARAALPDKLFGGSGQARSLWQSAFSEGPHITVLYDLLELYELARLSKKA